MVVKLNDLVQVNYKNASLSSRVISLCATALTKEMGLPLDYKSTQMPDIFWTKYNAIESDYKLIKKELLGVQEKNQRTLICYRYPTLKAVWQDLIEPSGALSVFQDSKEYEQVWKNITKYYPEMKILSVAEGTFVIKYAYERFMYEENKTKYPDFKQVMACFSHWIDKSQRHIDAAVMLNEIYERISKAA